MKSSKNTKHPSKSHSAAHQVLRKYLLNTILGAMIALPFGVLIGLLLNPTLPTLTLPKIDLPDPLASYIEERSLLIAIIGPIFGFLLCIAMQKLGKLLPKIFFKQEPVGKDKVAILYQKDNPIKYFSGKNARYRPRQGQRVLQVSRSQKYPEIIHTCMSADRTPLTVHLSADTTIIDIDAYIAKNKDPRDIVVSEIRNTITREVGARDWQANLQNQHAIWRRLMKEVQDHIRPYGLQLNMVRIENITIEREHMTEAFRLAEDIQILDSKVRLADPRTIRLLTRKQNPPS